ncbi:hypothetical protein [Phocaeicola plebeius]|uniref:hypothetical protein n=1 Tax=Phocaeicola plebeius TaxID=310297 RepID=UPI0015F32391|nr:hypothetical protein [Phocaeicola plebeius]
MKSFASAKTYSLIVGCHGMGWLPVAQSKARAATKPRYYWEYSHTPLTRFFGGLTAEYQTEVTTLAKSLSNCGLKMEYIWGIERSGFFNGREKWAKGFENQRV